MPVRPGFQKPAIPGEALRQSLGGVHPVHAQDQRLPCHTPPQAFGRRVGRGHPRRFRKGLGFDFDWEDTQAHAAPSDHQRIRVQNRGEPQPFGRRAEVLPVVGGLKADQIGR